MISTFKFPTQARWRETPTQSNGNDENDNARQRYRQREKAGRTRRAWTPSRVPTDSTSCNAYAINIVQHRIWMHRTIFQPLLQQQLEPMPDASASSFERGPRQISSSLRGARLKNSQQPLYFQETVPGTNYSPFQ